MAAKRLLDQSSSDPDQPDGKRIRTRPSFAAFVGFIVTWGFLHLNSVIGEVVMVQSIQKFCSALEPLLRKVVNEEVQHGLRRGVRSFSRSPSLRIEALQASTLQLVFSKKLSLPIFTGSKIEDVDNNPLQIHLVDTRGDQRVPITLPYPIKVEIVVLNGDFPPEDRGNWTSEEFDNKIVRERTGKRPLLTGNVLVTLRDGFAVIGDLTFTDNSSWIRSRNFKLGAKVAQGICEGVSIREAMTEPFVVKDHRGELYKKHYPPSLYDEVWRLERIGKDGAFHKKLASESITTVQDFLKLWVVDPARLRRVEILPLVYILGAGMSDKTWEVTIKHAMTCLMDNKLYMFRGPCYTIILNPICQVIGATLNGQTYSSRDLIGLNRAYVERLVKDAYVHWNSLEEVDGLLNENALLLPSGDSVGQYPNQHLNIVRWNQQYGSLTDGSIGVASLPISHNEYNECLQNQTYPGAPIGSANGYNMSDSSSDGDSTPSRVFFNGTL
ncbi:hypothetical protein HHK36_014954 [Tetracentron sinense]|uniref:Protein SAR DEFICIENT 1 n=1 Tax=Tetracentron sinense TaxID=13715 RepID=A0A835DD68_TETSI|nr:hypothetical protein HHK36_014954 [Tetracentron sinense]